MKNIFLGILMGAFSSVAFSQSKIPYLKDNQLWVNDKPFLMIGGELHNSSASSIAYMESIWPKLKSLNVNTVLATITWDQLEKEEGKFDYALIDYLIEHGEKNKIKLVVIWFGSWKNGQSSYIPIWVKTDTKRFPRVQTADGRQLETLSAFADESRDADAKAFTALMQRIAERDFNQTVIMVQPENEVGIFQDIDYRKEVIRKFDTAVPKALTDYLTTNKKTLKAEVRTEWEKAGAKTTGTWKEVFGNNAQGKEFFMAWHYAKYINHIAESGRKKHNLPMFVNAWIVQKPDDLPGVYPNGGPVSRVMDIYKAAAPSIDIICPDIYLPNYREIYTQYFRKIDNPLLVPESSLDAARAFVAFAEFDAICFSPFGIEDAVGNVVFSHSYELLGELMPMITKFQGIGKMRGIHLTSEHQDEVLNISGYEINLKIQDSQKPAFGLIVNTSENEFFVVGMNFKATFQKQIGHQISYIGRVAEGRFVNGQWTEERWLNGDETYHHELLRALGREVRMDSKTKSKETESNKNTSDPFVYSPALTESIIAPSVYKVTLYQRSR